MKQIKTIKQKSLIFFVISGYTLLAQSSQGEIIFEENFDSQPDWQLTQPIGSNTAISSYNGENTIPTGFHSYRIQGSSYQNNQHNSIIIDNTNARGGLGKGMTFWNESGDTNCDSGGGWCSDNQIGIHLPNGHNELYVSYYIKFQSNWKWSNEASIMEKIWRVSHYHGGSPYIFFSNGNQHPLATGLLTVWNQGNANTSHMLNYRYEVTYYPDQANPEHDDRARVAYYPGGNYSGTGPEFSDTGQLGDGEWHLCQYHIKMNSSVGVTDGIIEYFFDGNLILRVDDLAWSDTGGQQSPRLNWNYITFGGNTYNHYAPISEFAEQWYAIDDIVISTTPINNQSPIEPRPQIKSIQLQ